MRRAARPGTAAPPTGGTERTEPPRISLEALRHVGYIYARSGWNEHDVTILIVTPAARGARNGNRVTALRWAGHLRALGHRVRIRESWDGDGYDLLVALHATKSASSVTRFHAARPTAPIVLALTGTDVYEDRLSSEAARASLAAARRLVVLQSSAVDALPAGDRAKARVIVQSAHAVAPSPAPSGAFQVCLLAHLRDVKDPLLAAAATRLLPASSRVRVVHLGRALDPALGEAARREATANPRYEWRGERTRAESLGTIAGSRALLVTSRLEGGANVVSEAIASNVPVLSTRIDGTVGLLGSGYPGYFPVGDAPALAALLQRIETDPRFLSSLQAHVDRVRPLVDPARELAAWESLLAELAPAPR